VDAESIFKALGDATRLRIIALLKEEELCVSEIEGGLSLSQPNASRHLAVLKNAGIIQVRRQAQKTYCKISTEFVKSYPFLLRELNGICDALPGTNTDRIALQQYRSAKRVPYGF
jgi:Predicted transcriptional regulators